MIYSVRIYDICICICLASHAAKGWELSCPLLLSSLWLLLSLLLLLALLPLVNAPSPPTKSLGFGGFDLSRLLILKGGNSHVR